MNSLESIPGLHKSFKNTASVPVTSIQFVFFCFDLVYFWNKPSSLRFDLFKFLNKQTSILIFLLFGISRVRFTSIFLISGISRGRFASILVSSWISRVRFASIFKIFGISQVRFASILKNAKMEASLCFDIVDIASLGGGRIGVRGRGDHAPTPQAGRVTDLASSPCAPNFAALSPMGLSFSPRRFLQSLTSFGAFSEYACFSPCRFLQSLTSFGAFSEYA